MLRDWFVCPGGGQKAPVSVLVKDHPRSSGSLRHHLKSLQVRTHTDQTCLLWSPQAPSVTSSRGDALGRYLLPLKDQSEDLRDQRFC